MNEELNFSTEPFYGIKKEVLMKDAQIIESTKKQGYHTYRECFYLSFAETQHDYIECGKSPRSLADMEVCNRIYVLADQLPYDTIADMYMEEMLPVQVKRMKKSIEQKNYLITTNKRKGEKGLSHKRLNNIYCWIDRVFKYAYDHGFVRKSILDDIKLSHYGGTEQLGRAVKRNFLSEKEWILFDKTFDEHAFSYFSHGAAKISIDKLRGMKEDIRPVCTFRCLLYKAFYSVAFYTGLRKNEIRGLKWNDLLPPNETGLYSIRLEKQFNDKCSSFVNKSDHVRNPKSKDSFRIVYVHVKCYEVINELRLFLLAHNMLDMDNFIFFDFFARNPKPIPETNLDRCFKKMIQLSGIIENSIQYQAGKREITIHGMRHAACTALLEKGMPKDKVAKFLGHSSTELVDYCYREFIQVQDLAEAEMIEAAKYFK